MVACKGSGKCFDFQGKAKHRIEMLQKVRVADGAGGRTTEFTTLGTFWAYIKESSMNEQVASSQLESKVTHRIVIRYQAQFKDTRATAVHIIKFDDRFFDIKGVANLEGTLKEEGKEFQRFKAVENDSIIIGDLDITDYVNIAETWGTLG